MIYPNRLVKSVLSETVFASQKHSNHRRKGAAAEPYINHLIEVAELVAGAVPEPDTNLVIAALLHDTIEDAGVTREELTRHFGEDVAELVAEVTDDKSLLKLERKRLQIVNAPKKSERAQIITLADKVSNLRSLHSSPPVSWDHERQTEYVLWAREVIDRLANPNPILLAEFDVVFKKLRSSSMDALKENEPPEESASKSAREAEDSAKHRRSSKLQQLERIDGLSDLPKEITEYPPTASLVSRRKLSPEEKLRVMDEFVRLVRAGHVKLAPGNTVLSESELSLQLQEPASLAIQ